MIKQLLTGGEDVKIYQRMACNSLFLQDKLSLRLSRGEDEEFADYEIRKDKKKAIDSCMIMGRGGGWDFTYFPLSHENGRNNLTIYGAASLFIWGAWETVKFTCIVAADLVEEIDVQVYWERGGDFRAPTDRIASFVREWMMREEPGAQGKPGAQEEPGTQEEFEK